MAIIIHPPMIDWHWMKQRPQHLMKELARLGHEVYYCNATQTDDDAETVEAGLHVVHDHRRWLRDELPVVRRQRQSPVGVWCSNPGRHETLEAYAPDWIVYDCADDFAEWLPYERRLVRDANLIVCTAERLAHRLSGMYPDKPLRLVRNGYDADLRLHEQAREPAERRRRLAGLPDAPPGRRRVAYAGAWAPWVDEAAVRYAAREIDADFYVIGAEFGRKFAIDADNVRYLGLQPHDRLGSLLPGMDCCLIPFRLTPVTLAVNPVKAYEYMAAGCPVVSSAMPECRLMAPHVDIAGDVKQFASLVAARLDDPGDREGRIAYALSNTWAHRAREVDRLLQECGLT